MLERRARARQYADAVAENLNDCLRAHNCPDIGVEDVTVSQLAFASEILQTPPSAWFPPRSILT